MAPKQESIVACVQNYRCASAQQVRSPRRVAGGRMEGVRHEREQVASVRVACVVRRDTDCKDVRTVLEMAVCSTWVF